MGQRLDRSARQDDGSSKLTVLLALIGLMAVLRYLVLADRRCRNAAPGAVRRAAGDRGAAATARPQRLRGAVPTDAVLRSSRPGPDGDAPGRPARHSAPAPAPAPVTAARPRLTTPLIAAPAALLERPVQRTRDGTDLEEAVAAPGFFDDLDALPVDTAGSLAGARPWDRPSGRALPGASVRSLDLRWVLALIGLFAVALALRLINHSSDYDLFIDEIEYSSIGQSVALGHGVVLFGTRFFLHPPLFFYLEAGILDVFGGTHAAPVQLVLELRPINCVIGAIECVALTQLVAALVSRRVAVLVGIFVAVDPFLALWDGRVLLETQAMTLAVAGWLCLEGIGRVEAAVARHARRRWALVVLGGLCFGGSLLTKETYAFVGIAPLAGMLVINSPLSRRITGTMLAIASGCYVVYLVTVSAAGNLPRWWSANSSGLQRVLGTKQITGFNRAGSHTSLGGSLSADLSLYLVSYLVIFAIAVAAVLGVVRWFRAARAGHRLSTRRRLAIALGAGVVAFVGYSVVFGAFETQIFYMCIVAGLPVLASEGTASPWVRTRARLSRRTIAVGLVLAGCLALAFDLAADVRLRVDRDTSLSQLVAYVDHHVPSGALVDSTDGVSQFLLQHVQIDGPVTLGGLQRDRPGYVVVDPGLADRGYELDPPTRGFDRWLEHHARVVFSTDGRSTGRLELYRTMYATSPSGGTA